MRLRGDYYADGSSRRTVAELEVGRDGSVAVLVGGARVTTARIGEVRITDRVGETPRRVTLRDGGVFETTDNDALDAALAQHGLGGGARLLHHIESRWAIALAFLGLVGLAGWWTVAYGLPLLAERVAFSLPASVRHSLGSSTLHMLDRTVFAPSALPEPTRTRLEARFAAMARELGLEGDARLHFRKGERTGPNAFALPSGDVILTDELVELGQVDDEIVAVLAHELGHVVRHHGLRHALQNSTVALLLLALSPEGAISSLVAGLPTLLVEARYSRDFEREADRYALSYLQSHGIDPAHFTRVLSRIPDGPQGLAFLSTHPSTSERAVLFGGG
jgi:Zn-dependent protease with chaperone function